MSDPFDLNGDGKLDAFEYALFEETLHEEEERRRRASLDPEDFGALFPCAALAGFIYEICLITGKVLYRHRNTDAFRGRYHSWRGGLQADQ